MAVQLDIVDRDGASVALGQIIEVQHCVGPYGKTQIVKGRLVEVDCYYGAKLELSEPAIWYTKDGRIPKVAGDSFYVSLPGRVVNGQFACMKQHDDFEHAHEAWVRVIESIVWEGNWGATSDGRYETKPVVSKTADGYCPGVVRSVINGEEEAPVWESARATLTQAIRDASDSVYRHHVDEYSEKDRPRGGG